ncbi:hypothetical protein LCGC14_1728510 [marine sediment metagenome]|uniref:Uncharacterized protein n=1 Tax=marine sediment metagenome TaxID=412755 RepID=A0A0F9JQT8_9ZZZZ
MNLKEYPLAKKPVRFLFNGDSPTFKVEVPKTEHPYLFYKDQPYLIKFDLDIEFFREHLFFDEVEDVGGSLKEEPVEDATGQDSESEPEEKDERPPYDKEELQKMRKTDLRELLEKLSPGKSCPVRKENIIKKILGLQ